MTSQTPKLKEQGDTSDWRTGIAGRSKATLAEVNNVLNRLGIRPFPIPATPARLTLTSLEFSGEKVATKPPAKDGAFRFSWHDLSTGAWALMTDENLRGKSSVIEVIKWLLRGEPSSALQADVQGWLKNARLDFRLFKENYRVETSFKDEVPKGRLVHIQQGKIDPLPLTTFDTKSEFKEAMSSFFMQRLGLDTIQAYRKDSDLPVTHEWPTLSGALFIGTNYSSLLGETVSDGLPGRLLQMYLGLPWISTLSSAKAALKGYQAKQIVRIRNAELEREPREKELSTIEIELAEKRCRFHAIPSPEGLRTQLRNAQFKFRKVSEEISKEDKRLAKAKKNRDAINDAHNEDLRELQFFKEGEAAQAIFRALEPEICPRCELVIGEERRKREQEYHDCSVCGEQISSTKDDSQEIQQVLLEREKASALAFKLASQEVEKLETHSRALNEKESAADLECIKIGQNLSNDFNEYHDLAGEIRTLESQRDTLLKSMKESERIEEPEGNELTILKATVKETEKRFEGLKQELLSETSKEITRLARDFGMTAISEAKLRGNATLQVTKGGHQTTYSKLTGGEQLRLKVSTVLAILSVAERKGLGRHPGLLFIDSPKNHQMIDEDFEHLLTGLESAIKSLSHLQVFVASTSSPSLRKWINPERLQYAQVGQFLW